MHLLEDHTVLWAKNTKVGFGLLREQGAESIHAKFNSLHQALNIPFSTSPSQKIVINY